MAGEQRIVLRGEYDPIVAFPEEVKLCVVYLGVRRGAGSQTTWFGGTAFFVAVPIDGTEQSAVYLTTAAHAIHGIKKLSADGLVWIRVNTRSGTAEERSVPIDKWQFHPSDAAIDVAATAWEPDPTVVEYRAIAAGAFAQDHESDTGDEVFITGMFIEHKGNRKNLPIVRAGHVALVAQEKIRSKMGEMVVHLIESRSTGGLSGSPVFVLRTGFTTRREMDAGVLYPLRGAMLLLGLIHGHWDDEIAKASKIEKINVGIAMVVPSSIILEVLNQECFVNDRKKQGADKKQAKSLPTMDFATEPTRGPKPKRLKLDGPFEDRIRESFKAKPPESPKR
ncbi:MAG: hypothetical protein ACREJO_00270 [Phycisphaerales bacterium]